jgi:hypothetical protein
MMAKARKAITATMTVTIMAAVPLEAGEDDGFAGLGLLLLADGLDWASLVSNFHIEHQFCDCRALLSYGRISRHSAGIPRLGVTHDNFRSRSKQVDLSE